MADPTLVSVTGEIDNASVTGTVIETVSVTATDNEFNWYASVTLYADFAAAGAAGYQITDFPDAPMDSPLIVRAVTNTAQDFHRYANWET